MNHDIKFNNLETHVYYQLLSGTIRILNRQTHHEGRFAYVGREGSQIAHHFRKSDLSTLATLSNPKHIFLTSLNRNPLKEKGQKHLFV